MSKFHQYRIGCDGSIERCEARRLLTTIDTIEFPKWEQKSVASSLGSIVTWVDVFGFEWMCFGCNVSALKHAPFCHSSRSYCRREANHFDPKISGNVLPFLTREDLVSLRNDEAKFHKKNTLSQKIYKQQIKEHDELGQLGQLGIDDICHVTTAAAAANLLSLKQLDNNVNNVTAAVPIDEPNVKNNVSGDGVVAVVEEMHLSKKKKTVWVTKKRLRKKLPIVVRKSLRQKKQMFLMRHIFQKPRLQNHLPKHQNLLPNHQNGNL